MKTKKFIGLLIVLILAIAVTVVYSTRFPKYGNTAEEIAQLATRRDGFSQFVFGTDVEVYSVKDTDTYRLVVVRPLDKEDEQFGYLYFRRVSTGDYELKSSTTWAPNDSIQVYRMDMDGKSYDMIMYNNSSVVLAQRTDSFGIIENLTVDSSNGITPWEVQNYAYTYQCITSGGSKLSQ